MNPENPGIGISHLASLLETPNESSELNYIYIYFEEVHMVIENIGFGLNNKNCSIEIRIVKKKKLVLKISSSRRSISMQFLITINKFIYSGSRSNSKLTLDCAARSCKKQMYLNSIKINVNKVSARILGSKKILDT